MRPAPGETERRRRGREGRRDRRRQPTGPRARGTRARSRRETGHCARAIPEAAHASGAERPAPALQRRARPAARRPPGTETRRRRPPPPVPRTRPRTRATASPPPSPMRILVPFLGGTHRRSRAQAKKAPDHAQRGAERREQRRRPQAAVQLHSRPSDHADREDPGGAETRKASDFASEARRSTLAIVHERAPARRRKLARRSSRAATPPEETPIPKRRSRLGGRLRTREANACEKNRKRTARGFSNASESADSRLGRPRRTLSRRSARGRRGPAPRGGSKGRHLKSGAVWPIMPRRPSGGRPMSPTQETEAMAHTAGDAAPDLRVQAAERPTGSRGRAANGPRAASASARVAPASPPDAS